MSNNFCQHITQSMATTLVDWQCHECGALLPLSPEELLEVRGEKWLEEHKEINEPIQNRQPRR